MARTKFSYTTATLATVFWTAVFAYGDAAGLPTPVFEYHGSAFVVTILKDTWTRTALESLDLNPDQIKAVSYVKVNGWISSARYAELYKVPMRTSSRELGELARKGVFVLVGKGRQSRYELKSNRARIAPIAPNSEQVQKSSKNKGKSKFDRSLSPQTTTETAQEMSPQMSPQNISDGATSVLATKQRGVLSIWRKPSIKVGQISD